MSRCIHVYPFVARNHGGIPFSGVCPSFYGTTRQSCWFSLRWNERVVGEFYFIFVSRKSQEVELGDRLRIGII